jgi:hypothetical protein
MKGPPEACPAAHRALKIDCFMNDPAPVAQTCHWRAEDANQKCCSSKGTKKLLRGGHRSSPYRAFCRWPSAHFFAFPASWGSTARLSGRSFCKQRLAIASSNVRPLQQISKTRLAQAAGDLPHKTSEPVLIFAPLAECFINPGPRASDIFPAAGTFVSQFDARNPRHHPTKAPAPLSSTPE